MEIYKVTTSEQTQYFMFRKVAEGWANDEVQRLGENVGIETIEVITRARV